MQARLTVPALWHRKALQVCTPPCRVPRHVPHSLGSHCIASLPPTRLVHRQDPAGYKSAMVALGVEKPHPANAEQAFGFSVDRADRTEWKKVAGAHEQWPPPAPGSSYDVDHEVLARGRPNYAAGLVSGLS